MVVVLILLMVMVIFLCTMSHLNVGDTGYITKNFNVNRHQFSKGEAVTIVDYRYSLPEQNFWGYKVTKNGDSDKVPVAVRERDVSATPVDA